MLSNPIEIMSTFAPCLYELEMKTKNTVCVLFCLLFAGLWQLQAQDFQGIICDNHIYDEAVGGLKVSVADAHCAPLVIALGSGQYFNVSFDDLNAQLRDLKYTVIHCTYDWKPTPSLMKSEYLNGFEEGYINEYAYSMTTLQHYLNYHFTFPNEDMQLSKSGNYLLCVYEDEEHLLFTYRLMVVEEKVSVHPDLQASTNVAERFTHQEIRFQVKPEAVRLINPAQSVKVVLMQNKRADNAMLFPKPYAQQGEVLLYDKAGDNIMEGGSEFHRFNMRSMVKTLENVREVSRTEENYHVYVYPDLDRSFKPYISESDINGCCLLLSDTEALAFEVDYARTHFELQYDHPLDGDLYIFGELTHWRFLPEAKMTYRPDRHSYTGELYLRAGYYNYTYLYVPKGAACGDWSVEGTHWETENEYTFLVYYHPGGTDYDQLIGYKQSYFTR